MLSPRRAFVVHLDSSSDLLAKHPIGRVEHVPTGDSEHFESLEALFSFFARYAEDPAELMHDAGKK